MSQLLLVPSLLLILALPAGGGVSATAPRSPRSPGERAAIRATVVDYIEGYYTGDAVRMERALHPDYLKHTINAAGHVSEWSGLRMIQAARSGEGRRLPAYQRREQVTVLDVSGDVAAAKLVTPRWVDYLTLIRTDSRWRILSVVLKQSE